MERRTLLQRATQALVAGAVTNNDKLAADAGKLVGLNPGIDAGDQRHMVYNFEGGPPERQAKDLIRAVQDEIYDARISAKQTKRFDPAIAALTSCSRVYKAALQERAMAERSVHNRLFYATQRHPTIATLAIKLLSLKA